MFSLPGHGLGNSASALLAFGLGSLWIEIIIEPEVPEERVVGIGARAAPVKQKITIRIGFRDKTFSRTYQIKDILGKILAQLFQDRETHIKDEIIIEAKKL